MLDGQNKAENKSESASNGGEMRPSITLPKGGGAIRGIGEKFAANPVTGTGSMTIPIATSPGRSGFGPQLSLSYDSGAANGPFGLGWTLSLPSITRKTDKGLPRYEDADESDVFILSGAEDLVPVFKVNPSTGEFLKDAKGEFVFEESPRDGYLIRRYRPRIEGLFARIERWTNQANPSDVFWRSISKDNITTWYGKTEESRIANPADASQIFSWLICQSFDDKGNAIVYKYAAEDSANVNFAQPQEFNRGDADSVLRTAQRYLKNIKYGNREPNRDVAWIATDPAQLPDSTWMFDVVFDYGEGHYQQQSETNGNVIAQAVIDLPPNSSWPIRKDPFSLYRAGFEVRTYRLCQRVLMFHHFPAELEITDYLVRSTEFTYNQSPIASFITGVTQSGYLRQSNGTYLKKSLPPLAFEYTQAIVNEEVHEVDPESLENLPAGADLLNYQWLDLDGEGLQGVLSEQQDGWYYKRNLSPIPIVKENGKEELAARFEPLVQVSAHPSIGEAMNARHQFLDLAGDGQLDLVQFDKPVSGFFERTANEQWDSFVPFGSLPNLTWTDSNLKFLDLTGDGHADILITEDDALTWYASLAEQGFETAVRIPKPHDEEKGPAVVFADGTQAIFIADMSGDGLGDIVRIRNGEACYWPNYGYCRFGAKVTMGNSPWFDAQDQFDEKRIRLADIDGSGTTDIIYLHRDGVDIYRNQSGNKWSDAERLSTFPAADNVSSVQAVDLLGNGTACLVWTSPLPGDALRPMRYIDLMGGQKPHLLVRVRNNLGAETVVQYAPSTKFYLQDKRDGKPWITRLPFPVHCVERVETYDRVSGNRFVSRYKYHHGYFDGVEREFRGFGMVEQWDTEEIGSVPDEETSSIATNLDAASFVPPIHTKTWFHTGVYLGRDRISNYFAGLGDGAYTGEYYREPGWNDPEATKVLLDDTVLPTELTIDEEREACRALKGAMLRQEVYGLDATDKAQHPYTVTEQNFTVEVLQPRGSNQHAVFFTHAREALSFHYERNPHHRRVGHSLTLEVDKYGNVLKSVAIGYGRKQSPLTEQSDQHKQTQTLITYTDNSVTISVDDPTHPDDYRAPLPGEVRTYELHADPNNGGYEPSGENGFFQFSDFVETVGGELKLISTGVGEIAYESSLAQDKTRRLIENVRTLYRKDDLTDLLPLGQLESLALPGESFKLAFTMGLLTQVYKRKLEAAPEENLLPEPAQVLSGHGSDQGGYVDLDGNGHWWIPSGRLFYSTAGNVSDPAVTAAAELIEARQHFFSPRKFADPFDHSSLVDYDPHDLLLIKTEDALQNTVTVIDDYRVLQPRQMTDPNGNRSEVQFDALGLVVGTAVRGKAAGPDDGDSFDTFAAHLTPAQIAAYFDALNPRPLAVAHLGTATTRIIYDFDRVPACAASIARETHVSDLAQEEQTKVQLTFVYSDGFGREAQTKIQAEPGPVDPNNPASPMLDPRWVGTGAKIYNNKGKPVRQYEPFFSPTHHFGIEQHGVSSTLFYDPVERAVATLHPNHTWEKVVFDPWQQANYDVNDTVLNADGSTDPKLDEDVSGFFSRLPVTDYLPTWYEQRITLPASDPERVAADKAAVHHQTPAVAHLDTLGRAFLTIAHNRFERNNAIVEEKYPTRVELDIEGNQRAVRDAVVQNGDAMGRIVMRYDYDMLGNRIHQASMEAGERWMLNDVTGKPIRAWDSRGFTRRIRYDELRRATGLFVMQNGFDRLAERTMYGEGQGAAHNHRTRVFQVFDGAGVVTSEAYDFKGNLLRSRRELLPDYKGEVDWQQNPTPSDGTFTSSTTYDALNRPIELITPHNTTTPASVIRHVFNEANLLDKVEVNLRGATTATPLVTNIDYNAKGQRTLIRYANGAETTYEYDDQTFRLIHLKTTRAPGQNGLASQIFKNGATIQDLRYTYDPAGNITRIADDALPVIAHDNQQVAPVCDYTYDAIHRLIEARGREHIGQTAFDFSPPNGNFRDYPFAGLGAHPNDLQALRNYIERYEYDAVGNFGFMRHIANGGSWTRGYECDAASLIEPAKQNNRLTRTTIGNGTNFVESYTYTDALGNDVHGCMTAINNLKMVWDFEDQLQQVDLGGGGMAYYVYDARGQRVRKVIETQNETRKDERTYLGGFEIYRKYNGDGAAVTLERETLHVMDDKQRIALVETKTVENANPINAPAPVQRYQLGNHLGSASLELDEDGGLISYDEYHPYGTTAYQAMNSAAEVSLKRYRYTGKERDEETGLYYQGARYYAPWLARWTSCDPLGISGGLNLYAYAANKPTGMTDPTGGQPTTAPGRERPQNEELDPEVARAAGKAFSEYDPGEPDAVVDARIAKVSDPSYAPQSPAASTAAEDEIDIVDVAKKAAFVGYLPFLIPYILVTQAAEDIGYLAREAGMSELNIAQANFALMMAGPGEMEALGYGIEALGAEIRSMQPAVKTFLADTRGAIRIPTGAAAPESASGGLPVHAATVAEETARSITVTSQLTPQQIEATGQYMNKFYQNPRRPSEAGYAMHEALGAFRKGTDLRPEGGAIEVKTIMPYQQLTAERVLGASAQSLRDAQALAREDTAALRAEGLLSESESVVRLRIVEFYEFKTGIKYRTY